MKAKWFIGRGNFAGAFGVLCVAIALYAEPQDRNVTKPAENNASASGSQDEVVRVDTSVARDSAKQMHEIYSATLEVIHRRYFHGERATIPARAMEDVFAEMKHRSKIEARWISVNTKAMSIDHDPKTEFEKRAARELAEGKMAIEVVEDGFYRRAGAISLNSGCLSCHEGLIQSSSRKPRYAGLVISIPVEVDSGKTD